MANRIFATPLVGYFGDYGAMLPDSLSKPGRSTFSSFCTKLAILLKMDKSLVYKALTFLGLFGEFPDNNNDNILRISLPTDKATRWGEIIASNIAPGRILHSDLDKLIARLSFSQAAIFGSFGRAILRPLYNKLTGKYDPNKLERHELDAIRWWETAIGQMRHRIAYPEPKSPTLRYTPTPPKKLALSRR